MPIRLIIDLEGNNYIFHPNFCLKEVDLTGKNKLNDLIINLGKP